MNILNKKKKKPGDQVLFRLKSQEQEEIVNWINAQSNFSDSFRYLIEMDIIKNGCRDIQEIIPSKRKSIKTMIEEMKQRKGFKVNKEEPIFVSISQEENLLEIEDEIENKYTFNEPIENDDIDEDLIIEEIEEIESNEEDGHNKYEDKIFNAWEKI